MRYAELKFEQKEQLGRILMKQIISTLTPYDFGLGKSKKQQDVIEGSGRKQVFHPNYSASELLDLYYAKLEGDAKQVLDEFPEYVIEFKGLIPYSTAKEHDIALKYNKEKKNGNRKG